MDWGRKRAIGCRGEVKPARDAAAALGIVMDQAGFDETAEAALPFRGGAGDLLDLAVPGAAQHAHQGAEQTPFSGGQTEPPLLNFNGPGFHAPSLEGPGGQNRDHTRKFLKKLFTAGPYFTRHRPTTHEHNMDGPK